MGSPRANRLDWVTVAPIGLARHSGEQILFESLPDNHTPTMLGEPGSPGTAVAVRTLDACLAEWRVDHVDLLKIDVEGFEPEVFGGATEALEQGRIGAVLCELNDHWLQRARTSAKALYESLVGSGFEDVTGRARQLAAGATINCFLVRRRARRLGGA